jgi:hypothetical protein
MAQNGSHGLVNTGLFFVCYREVSRRLIYR